VDSRVVVRITEFLVGRTQRVSVLGKLSKEVKLSYTARERFRLTSVSSEIWSKIESSIRLFVDNCMNYRKIRNEKGIYNLQNEWNGRWKMWLK
jgi:hypothetical protein